MYTIIEAFSNGYVSLIANVGLLSLLAWCISYFDFNLTPDVSDQKRSAALKSGFLFGISAVLLMNLPIEFAPGIISDARGAPLLMAGIVGGPVSVVITAVMASAARLYIGGIGAPAGVMYILTFAGSGLLWRHYCIQRNKPMFAPIEMVLLATASTAITTPYVLTFPEAFQYKVLVGAWPQLWVANVVCVWLLSLLIGKEIERRLFEARLQEEVQKTTQASKAKAKFLTAMSHEIRTPLNGILGVIQVVLQDKLPPKTEADLRVARSSGFFLLGLINQVLDFAKIESGKSVIFKQDFDIEPLVDGLRSIFQFQLETKGLEFQTDISPEANGRFHGDLEHIRQILFNLLGNAAKFTEKGHVKLTVALETAEEPRFLKFTVVDTGPGIPETQLSKIFEEFEQADSNLNAGGTGLGLAIVKGLSTDLGGDITVESTVGLGSKFTVCIPIEAAKEQAFDIAPTGAMLTVERSLSILVAEDNSVNQMVIRSLLTNCGHSVTLAANGQEVVDAIGVAPDRYDLILMDIQMPVMNGIDATKLIRANSAIRDDFLIIALTANAFAEQRDEYLSAGMNDVLIKPVQLAELNKILVKYFGGTTNPLPRIEEKPVVDFSMLSNLCSSLGDTIVNDLLQKAQATSDTIIFKLKMDNSNAEIGDDLLHELKGMISNFGFEPIVDKLEHLRSLGLSSRELSPHIPELEEALQTSFKAALTYVSQFEETTFERKSAAS